MDKRRTVGNIQTADARISMYYSPFVALIAPGLVFASAPT
jgi:hypothetical protein